jgi:hypothetical protein
MERLPTQIYRCFFLICFYNHQEIAGFLLVLLLLGIGITTHLCVEAQDAHRPVDVTERRRQKSVSDSKITTEISSRSN